MSFTKLSKIVHGPMKGGGGKGGGGKRGKAEDAVNNF